MSEIKTWVQRLPSDTPDDGDVIHAMQSEINELRAALEQEHNECCQVVAAFEKSDAELRAALKERDAKLAALEGREPVAYHYKYFDVFGKEVWAVGDRVHPYAIEFHPLARIPKACAEETPAAAKLYAEAGAAPEREPLGFQVRRAIKAEDALRGIEAAISNLRIPTRKNQSPVLFEDGYEEGWEKCVESLKAMLAAAPKESTNGRS